jgi:hypothetical protein
VILCPLLESANPSLLIVNQVWCIGGELRTRELDRVRQEGKHTTCCLLSGLAVCCLLPAACYLLSAVWCLMSDVWCLVSTVCCLLSAVCCLLSAVSGDLCFRQLISVYEKDTHKHTHLHTSHTYTHTTTHAYMHARTYAHMRAHTCIYKQASVCKCVRDSARFDMSIFAPQFKVQQKFNWVGQ